MEAIVGLLDEGLPEKKIDCIKDINKLIASTREIKLKAYDKVVEEFASMASNTATATQLGSPYLLTDNPDFNANDFFTDYVLPVKLNLINNPDYSSHRFYVLFKEIEFALPEDERVKLAEDVAKKMNLAQGSSNSLVVVVPYYPSTCNSSGTKFIGDYKQTMILMPGAHSSNASLASLANSSLSNTSLTWEDAVKSIIKEIPKRHVSYSYSFLLSGDIIYHGKRDEQSIKGFENMVDLVLQIDERFDRMKETRKKLYDQNLSYTIRFQHTTPTEQDIEENMLAFRNFNYKLAEIEASPATFRLAQNLNLNENILTERLAGEFVQWFAKRHKWGLFGFVHSFSAPEDVLFYGERNLEKVKDYLVWVDIASAGASVVGLDVFFESFGAYYAYNNGLYEEAAFYATAAAIPIANGAALKAVMNSGEYMLKTMKGKYVVRPRNVLGCGPVFGIEDNFSPFLRNSIDLDNYSTIAKYKREKEFLNALEEGFIGSEEAKRKFNQHPRYFDDYFETRKTQNIDVAAFIARKDLIEASLGRIRTRNPGLDFNTFRADFGNDLDILTKFEKGEISVEGWKALGEFPSLRKIPANLEVLDKVKGKFTYNGKIGQEALEEIFTGHKSAQKFIDNFKKYDEIIGNIDDITVTGIKSSSEVRILNKGSQVGKIVDGKFYLKHDGWGSDILMTEGRRTTILGKYLENQAGGTHSLLQSGIVNKTFKRKEGFRILSSSEIDQIFIKAQNAIKNGNFDLADDLFEQAWEINRKWLDEAIDNGDVIRLISAPTPGNLTLINHKGEIVLSFYGREKVYLESKGYIQQGYDFIKQ